MVNIAINGAGRIGLIAARIIAKRDDLRLIAINSTTTNEVLEYLLKYDSIHNVDIEIKLLSENKILIGKDEVKILSDRDPNNLDFGSLGVEIVLECSGQFLTKQKAEPFLKNGVKKVIMSAPAKDDTPTFVIGVNHKNYSGEAIISNASCTTNALAPIVKVLNDNFGVLNGLMTTIHSYTNDQNLLDSKHSKDFRRARAAAVNMLPTTTGAAKAIGLVIPELKGKLNGYAMRVPTPDVSSIDLNVTLAKSVTKEEVNQAFEVASESYMSGLIEIDRDKRVSSDFVGSEYSSILVPDMITVVDNNMLKVLAWYDNEYGYTTRLVDLATYVAGK